MQQETRKLQRMQVLSYVKVCEQKDDLALGHLVDITTQGLRVVSPKALLPHSIIHLRLDLPTADDGVQKLHFKAQVIWSRASAEFESWDTGLQLVNVTDDECDHIERFMQNAAYEDRWLSIGNPTSHEY